MNTARFENIWKIMKDFDLDMGDFNKRELHCLICERIMIRASSGPCGCRYCFACISRYVDEGNRHCPGTSSYCNEDVLDYEINIVFDQAINSQVLQLKTRCPFESCSYRTELRHMEGHVKICSSRPENLLYSTAVRFEDTSERDNCKHSASMIKDIDTLKMEIETFKATITDMKQNFEQYQNSELQKHSRMYAELAKWLNEEKRPMTTEEEWKQIDVSELQLKSKSLQDVVSKIDQLYRRMFEVEMNLVKQNYGELVWIIKNISEQITNKRATTVFGEAFYSHRNGYKMCLFICPSGLQSGEGTHLYFGFCLMKGAFDDILPWPCKHIVTLTLMNQRSKSEHCCKKVEYNPANHRRWDRPENNMNMGLGKSHFISLNELLSNKELIENDQIIIKCTVNASIKN